MSSAALSDLRERGIHGGFHGAWCWDRVVPELERLGHEALALDPLPKVIWMQLSVRNDAAAARAEAKGVTVVMNRCPKIEYGRLSGEIGWTGVNSRILSSKKPAMFKGFQKFTIERR